MDEPIRIIESKEKKYTTKSPQSPSTPFNLPRKGIILDGILSNPPSLPTPPGTPGSPLIPQQVLPGKPGELIEISVVMGMKTLKKSIKELHLDNTMTGFDNPNTLTNIYDTQYKKSDLESLPSLLEGKQMIQLEKLISELSAKQKPQSILYGGFTDDLHKSIPQVYIYIYIYTK